jgi:hypothetical protein
MNTYTQYSNLTQEGRVFQDVAAALSMTPRQLWENDVDIFQLLEAVESPAPGQLHGIFKAGITMDVSYDPATLTVTHVRLYHNGQLAVEFSGAMTAEAFLYGDWPADVYGSNGDDYLFVDGANKVFAGAGNDIIELEGSAVGYGQGGADTFVVMSGQGDHITIADYQPGEKILFYSYDDWQSLVSSFQGVSESGPTGFTLQFGGPGYPQWSLTIQGTPLEQMRVEDLLVGQAAHDQVYAPVYAAFGLL